MSIQYVIDKSRGTIFTVWDGTVTAEDWYANINQVLAEPDLPVIRRMIIDTQTVSDTTTIGDAEIETVTVLLKAQLKILFNKSVAVFADNTFGKAKRAETSISRIGIPIVVFNHLDTACTFLGIPEADTRQTLEGLRSKLRSSEI